jgi:UDP-N-acetyl-D-glucosamine/UDP-N-acetyl-D-galactosamine dehydrogenase
MSHQENEKIAVVGLGYVGLPLAVELGKHRPVVGFDINPRRIQELQSGLDATLEVERSGLQAASHLSFSSDEAQLSECRVFIVTVPTPVDQANRPDMTPLVRASQTVGRSLKRGDLVIYESTVYPGATEEVCVPELERASGLTFNLDFTCGYSPERINPGDKVNTLTTIRKITSGSTPEAAEKVDALYSSIITAGTWKASSLKVAEAAKVIENSQRDLNIAFVNELAVIFERMGIDTQEVLNAAGTKWNFLPFRPGLVGGHCIGVDPYYLTHKAEMLGYHPQVILAGRRINDGMAAYIAQQTVKQMIREGTSIKGAKVLVLGLTFKENCSDLRNSKVADVVKELVDFGCDVVVHDPLADAGQALHEYGIELTEWSDLPAAVDAVVAAVSHAEYVQQPVGQLLSVLKPGGVFIDIKSAYPPEAVSAAGARLWRL